MTKNGIKKTISVGIAITILASVTALSLIPLTRLPHTNNWFTAIPFGDKAVHFTMWFCLITAIRLARTLFGLYDRTCPWKLLIFAAVYGGGIELLQGHYFDRGADIWDEAANILGAVTALWAIPQRWHKKHSD
jgi:glycopeptide antibiotics resistance protein